MTCPWNKTPVVAEPISLSEIMSEEMARNLQAKEDQKFGWTPPKEAPSVSVSDSATTDDIPNEILKAISNDSMESDAKIAEMLQIQFDKEHDEMLKRAENKLNGGSKVTVSFENYKRAPLNNDFESDSEEDEIVDIRDRKSWDRFDNVLKDMASMPVCGYKVNSNGELITKHDLVNSGRKNACKLLSFPPEFQTGDGEDFDLKISNKVYNHLRIYSTKDEGRKKRQRDKKEDEATATFGVDKKTRLTIFKLIATHEMLLEVNGVISIGKEAVIVHATSNPNYQGVEAPLPPECALKVFKTTLSEFKNRQIYIRDDRRFSGRVGNQTSKKTISIWTEKELANLTRLKRAAGVNCPDVLTHRNNVLVMSFIGHNQIAAPKLKDALLTDAEWIMAYDQVISSMKRMYTHANLIHADLSEYNILWHNDLCYFIDVSQSIEPTHENAFHFLHRDCTNIYNFFNKKGVPKVMDPDELFKEIVGVNYEDKVEVEKQQEPTKLKPHMVDRPGRVESNFNFESQWENLNKQHE